MRASCGWPFSLTPRKEIHKTMNPTIELPVGELKTALTGLNKISITRSFNPALGCVRIHATSDQIQIQATNLDEFAAFQCSSTNAVEPQEFLVPLEPLNRLVKNINAKATIRLSPKDDQSVTLAYPVGGTFLEQNHATVPLSEWPVIPQIETGAVEVDSKFKSALKAALDCSSNEPTRYILNGAFVDVSDPKAHYLVGCDGRHLFAANSFCLGLKDSVIIPNRGKFINWSGFQDDGNWLLSAQAANEKEKVIGWVKLESKHWTFITKQIEGIYPNWRQVIPQHVRAAKTTVEFQPDAVSFLLEVLPKLPGYDEVNQSVSLSVQDQEFKVLARKNKSTDTRSSMVVPGCVIQGSNITITVNRSLVMKALKLGFTTMEMSEPESAILFRSEGRKLIVQPLKTDHPKAATAETTETSETSETPDTTTPPATTIAAVEKSEPPEAPDEPTTVNPQPNPQIINPMPKETTPATTTTEPTEENGSPIKAAIKQIDQIKNTLRKAIWDMHDLVKTLALANKEQRATEKETEAIRETVRSLQRVKL